MKLRFSTFRVRIMEIIFYFLLVFNWWMNLWTIFLSYGNLHVILICLRFSRTSDLSSWCSLLNGNCLMSHGWFRSGCVRNKAECMGCLPPAPSTPRMHRQRLSLSQTSLRISECMIHIYLHEVLRNTIAQGRAKKPEKGPKNRSCWGLTIPLAYH